MKFYTTTAVATLAACLASGCMEPQDGPAPEPVASATPTPAPTPAAVDASFLPAGTYRLDKSHASLTFHVNHLGFSNYTGSFEDFDATLQLDPAALASAQVTATINLSSLAIPAPPEGFRDALLGEQWLGANAMPQIAFLSTRVEPTGPATADITGTMSMNGASAPITLHAVYNGGWEGNPFDPHARVGFSATGTLNRSAFGVKAGIPEPGTTMGVSDAVTFEIEAEFSGPAWTAPATPQTEATPQPEPTAIETPEEI